MTAAVLRWPARAPDLNRKLRRFASGRHVALPPLTAPPTLEVVVPCYNHADFLEPALESILAQTYEGPFGVALIDDRSTDRTPAVIERFVESVGDARIAARRLSNDRNLRQWASLNRAIGSSGADLVMVLNDDDLLLPDAVEKALAAFARHPEIAMLGAHSLWLESGSPAPTRAAVPFDEVGVQHWRPEDALRFHELEDLRMTHSSCTFRVAAWRAVDGYQPPRKRIHPAANEDRDFQMRIAALFPVVTLDDYPLAVWRTDSSHGQSF